jgi:penicillin G amidase
MKWLGRLALLLVIALLTAGAVVAVHLLRSMPQLDGSVRLAGLGAPVKISRDAADVTHIEGSHVLDTWRGLGFVHAQERGWQLEFNRRLMRGELSEILGPATLDTDKLMRTLGIIDMAAKQLQGLSPASQAALQAYSEGINNAWQSGAVRPSPEFTLLSTAAGGKSGKAWTPQDSLGWALMMALDLGGNWGQEFARLSASQVLNHEQLWQLLPPYPGEKPATAVDLPALYKELGVFAPAAPKAAQATTPTHLALAQWSRDWVRDVGILEGKGSNNWVVPGSRTVSGKPLLANDPHLALSSPAIWYFAHLKAPEGHLPGHGPHPALDVIGATLPGLPFVVLGRTQGVAWGFTNTGPDVQDLYLEQLDPSQPGKYRTPSAWADFEVRPETIRVKGQGDVILPVRSTRHGPVISDVQPQYKGLIDAQRYVVSLRWSALTEDNKTVEAGMMTNWAQTVPQLQKAFTQNHAPMQSVVMADTLGEVAYQAVGKLPIRSPLNDIRGVAPAPGWLAQYDWTGWLPAAQNPAVDHTAIEKKGWHATANQNILPPGYAHFIGGDWTTPERFDRIEALLAATPQHSLQSMQAIQNDVMSLGAKRLLARLLAAKPTHPLGAQVMPMLAAYDGQMHKDSAQALIVNVWADELTRRLLSPKLGADRFQSLYGKRHFRAALEGILASNDAFWCSQGDCASEVSAALDSALKRIVQRQGSNLAHWRWGDWHPAISSHKPFGKVPFLNALFDVRTESAGDLFTVNVGQYWANDLKEPFANRHAASMRAIYDLSVPEQSLFIYQTGQSGHVFDPRSKNMAQAWASGHYRPLQAQSAALHVMTLNP